MNLFVFLFYFFFLLILIRLFSFLSTLDEGDFTFTLTAYSDSGHTTAVSGSVDLNVDIYFKAEVTTQSSGPNLDLHLVSCYSSKSSDGASTDGKFILITNG